MEYSRKIYVFGSNLAGQHNQGHAFHALLHYGAINGVAEGLQGQSYAIPTKDASMKNLRLQTIYKHIGKFIDFANVNTDMKFIISQIGVGVKQYNKEDIAPMFALVPLNCFLPKSWQPYLPGDSYNFL